MCAQENHDSNHDVYLWPGPVAMAIWQFRSFFHLRHHHQISCLALNFEYDRDYLDFLTNVIEYEYDYSKIFDDYT